MGKKSKASSRPAGQASGRKRKAGFLGFQSGEIAFIEDEMAALAAEYGLQLDGDVASHVRERSSAKKSKARRRQLPQEADAAPTKANSKSMPSGTPRIRLLAATETTKSTKRKANEDKETLGPVDEQKLVLSLLATVLPDTCALRACAVPGCSCVNGSRSMGFPEQQDDEDKAQDTLKFAQCLKCQHGVLQHTVTLREDADVAATLPSGGQRLLVALYQLIRLARLASSIYKSRIWTKSALDRLGLLLAHLKRQFATGGTQNGQKSAGELRQEMQLLTELQTQLRKAQQAVATGARDELPILLACICDQMYFQTYYAALVLYGRASGTVPAPDVYLKELESFTPESASQLEGFLNTELLSSGLVAALALPLASSSSQDELARERLRVVEQERENPLLTIYHARLREGIRLFYEEGVGMGGEMDVVLNGSDTTTSTSARPKSSKKKPQKKHYRREKNSSSSTKGQADEGSTSTLTEMPSYPLLAQWRNNCRDWCCHLYAYATPTREALKLLTQYGPIVEIGAGTGYWSSLLQREGVDVLAFDKCPPNVEDATANAYHGHVPPFCSVARGGPEVLGKSENEMAGRSLLLCYPPPGDAMAVRSVQLFQGDVVLHVGEWQGDTGDRRFEAELQRRFVLEQQLELPNWGNSAYALSVWRRKATEVPGVAWRAMSCFHCGKTLADAAAECEPLRRCVVCKTNVYCSASCAEQDARAHAAEHAKRLVFLDEASSVHVFENDAYYQELKELDLDDAVVAVKSDWNALTKSSEATQDGSDSDSDEELSENEQPAKTAGFAFNFQA
ncbi:hypothetical protein BBJ28_00005016 [Nothophytophthora sp. Chile5]|nr:hypothetical protein BBJ28_00005016 [Nothophytophthora sp. Chile5]